MKPFSEKLLDLRRREGLSQEQLADRLGVTRQSVSKWESGTAVPELSKLIALSELFSVSVDYLVKDHLEEPERPSEPPAPSTAKLEAQVEEISRLFRSWTWESKTKLFGLPLVSVCLSFYPHMLRCLLAFGPVALGLWYAGGVAALGGKIAVGVAAVGETAVGYDAAGKHILLWGNGLTQPEVEAFLLEHHPKLWKPLLKLLALFGANIK